MFSVEVEEFGSASLECSATGYSLFYIKQILDLFVWKPRVRLLCLIKQIQLRTDLLKTFEGHWK